MTSAINFPTQPITFTASWNDANENFDETLLEKISRFFLGLINNIARASILPASTNGEAHIQDVADNFKWKWTVEDQFLLLHNNFTPTPIEVTAPDGVKIRGTHFKNRAAQENSPTVICFQANGAISKQGVYDWMLNQAAIQEVPYNFVYFDYRGCGESEKIAARSAKDYYLDGESIYQFVRDKLHVPVSRIHFYGWSFGGGVSAKVKEVHPECDGNYVNERSFSSVNDVIKNAIGMILAKIAGVFISFLNWNIQSAQAFDKIKGKSLIVHHPDDELMKNQASLYRSIFEKGTTVSSEIKEINLQRPSNPMEHIHGAPLAFFRTDSFNPEAEISQFLFSSNCTYNQRMVQIFRNSSLNFRTKVYETVARLYQNGGFYWGSAEDACNNRNGLFLTEEQLARAVTTAKLSTGGQPTV